VVKAHLPMNLQGSSHLRWWWWGWWHWVTIEDESGMVEHKQHELIKKMTTDHFVELEAMRGAERMAVATKAVADSSTLQ